MEFGSWDVIELSPEMRLPGRGDRRRWEKAGAWPADTRGDQERDFLAGEVLAGARGGESPRLEFPVHGRLPLRKGLFRDWHSGLGCCHPFGLDGRRPSASMRSA